MSYHSKDVRYKAIHYYDYPSKYQFCPNNGANGTFPKWEERGLLWRRSGMKIASWKHKYVLWLWYTFINPSSSEWVRKIMSLYPWNEIQLLYKGKRLACSLGDFKFLGAHIGEGDLNRANSGIHEFLS